MPRTPDTIIDEVLILGAQRGNADAFRCLVERWTPPLLRHATRLTDDTHEAHDVLQDTWLTIVRSLRSLEDPARFPAFAFRIVTRRAADHARRRRRARHHSAAVANTKPHPNPSPPPDAPAEARDESHALRDAIDRLPRHDQAILALRYHEDLSIAAIAHVLSIPRGTVKSRLHAARTQLKHALERNRQ